MTRNWIFIGLLWLCVCAHGCFYTSYDFNDKDNTQSKLSSLLSDVRNSDDDRPKNYFMAQMEKRGHQLAASKDPEDAEEYAYLLFRTGKIPEAEKLWKSLLLQDPANYEVMSTYATALHMAARYAEALPLLESAVKLRPGFRHGAEELHVQMIKFQLQSRVGMTAGAGAHLFIPELSPVWEKRQAPPHSFDNSSVSEGQISGLVELLHQFPTFGNGWHCLGILLEKKGELGDARRCYDLALRNYGSDKPGLERQIAALRGTEKEYSFLQGVGRSIRNLALSLALLTVLWFILRFIARKHKEVQEARERARREAERDMDLRASFPAEKKRLKRQT